MIVHLSTKQRFIAAGFGIFATILSTAPSVSAQRPTTVVVDAGHGGFDRGGIPRQRVGEKNLTLDVAQRLRSVLQTQGYRVVMTRNSDVFIPLGRRVAIANSYRNAVFVSIHFNSARRVGANGIETYFYNFQSARLASNIHRNVVAGAPSVNRGMRRRGYYVLRRARIPAVLVECGFLTNPMEARYAQTPSYRQKLAEQIARGIAGRSTARTTAGRAGYAETAIEPYIDQRFESRRRTKRSKKKRYSSSKSSRSKKSSKSSSSKKSSSKKKSTKKSSASADKSSSSSSEKKKSTTTKSEE